MPRPESRWQDARNTSQAGTPRLKGAADRIGEFWGHAETREFGELLIDCEEERTLRAVLVGMLEERWPPTPG